MGLVLQVSGGQVSPWQPFHSVQFVDGPHLMSLAAALGQAGCGHWPAPCRGVSRRVPAGAEDLPLAGDGAGHHWQ